MLVLAEISSCTFQWSSSLVFVHNTELLDSYCMVSLSFWVVSVCMCEENSTGVYDRETASV